MGDPYPFCHYVGITGIGKDAAWLPRNDPNAGVFGYERVLDMDDFKRGTANVMAVSETATENGPWAKGGYATARGLDLNGTYYLGNDGQFNSYHGKYLFSSAPCTTNVLMADASVRRLTDTTSDQVLEAMATITLRE